MGGSFDPVHVGHLIIARDAVEKLRLDEVIFIPASIPPHKQHLKKEDAHSRLKMLQLAVESDSHFSVSDIEVKRGGVSYTIDTVKEISAQRPADELTLIIGSDTLVDLHNWHKINELLGLCNVASFLRPGESDIDQIPEKVMLTDECREKLLSQTFMAHLIDISSTEIRERVAEGRNIDYLVPPAVEHFIYENSLYKG